MLLTRMTIPHARFATDDHAALWSGTTESWVSLHPTGAAYSLAWGVDGGQQVGEVQMASRHAALWTGSAESWVDLNPPGATASIAKGVYDERQVGFAYVDGAQRAGTWSGTATSWVDLHALLPNDFSSSLAEAIWSDGSLLHVVGSGFSNVTQSRHALMWTTTVPEPNTAILAFAVVIGGAM